MVAILRETDTLALETRKKQSIKTWLIRKEPDAGLVKQTEDLIRHRDGEHQFPRALRGFDGLRRIEQGTFPRFKVSFWP
jgi:hypothetical protein